MKIWQTQSKFSGLYKNLAKSVADIFSADNLADSGGVRGELVGGIRQNFEKSAAASIPMAASTAKIMIWSSAPTACNG